MPFPSRFLPSSCLIAAFVAVAPAFLTGCSTVHEVTVHASARPTSRAVAPASYRVVDQTATAETRALRRNEIASHIKTALSAQGLYEAPDAKSADMIVEVSYGIGPPHVQRTVYQEIAGGRPLTAAERAGPPPEGVQREVMGYVAFANVTTTREKHLSICAHRQATEGEADVGPPEDLWRVEVSIQDEGDDLRGHLPILASVAMDHMGRETEGPKSIRLRSDDEAIRFIERGQ